ncbi:MAG: class I SAM-dependent methyltransferase [Candidatus Vogelbacteria bacterium]|nr:class I SAM-dependent methyltransferase [Candidatus Vogelbacteria bacterium]
MIEKIYTKTGIVSGNPFSSEKVLHIGCGGSKLAGAVGMDILSLPNVDVIHDANKVPWPFGDGSFDIIFAHSVVEHLDNIVDFVNEAYRVGKNGGRIIINVPYFRSVDSFGDPTHAHFFTSKSFEYFLDDHNKLANYKYTSVKLHKVGFWYGWPQVSPNPLVRILKKFIHRYMDFYDQFLSIIIPVKCLVWELEIKK